mgnify:CR=1 FL=1
METRQPASRSLAVIFLYPSVGCFFDIRTISPSRRRYVVIGDMATTGVTLQACALALCESCANKIDLATFANG